MANTSNVARLTHVSPGIYTKETDLTYASKSLGITTLGVVGETLKGPAFQPILIENWREFQRYFGGTSTEKFKGSQYPKYELPYIAQDYLKQSEQLQVVRVLGLSGVNAGPAWILSASGNDPKTGEKKNYVIGIIRSRGEHRNATNIGLDECNNPIYEYDGITYFANEVTITPSKEYNFKEDCNGKSVDEDIKEYAIDSTNYGRFTFHVKTNYGEEKDYSVSLTPGDKHYIYNIIGGDPENGDSEIYVEEFYDVALKQLIEEGSVTEINQTLDFVPNFIIQPEFKPVDGILSRDESTLGRKDIGKRYLAVCFENDGKKYGDSWSDGEEKIKVTAYDSSTKSTTTEACENGQIYTVASYTTKEGTRKYYYKKMEGEALLDITESESSGRKIFVNTTLPSNDDNYDVTGIVKGEEQGFSDLVYGTIALRKVVYNNADGRYYVMGSFYLDGVPTDPDGILPISIDMNNYKEEYRFASTPWIVSEVKGDGDVVELNKLFRFHTISDGENANTEVKISIENINPSEGTFDVIVRDFYDVDSSLVVYERFRGVNLIPGDKNYIAYRIGSYDDSYANVSRFITVEVNENDKTTISSPAGFLGYPVRDYNGVAVYKRGVKYQKPILKYNTNVDDTIRINKQYFGMSNITGIDVDVLKYKGVESYNGVPSGMTPGFHLDSRILSEADKVELDIEQTVSVDGETGYEWSSVGRDNTYGIFDEIPVFGTNEQMGNTIYEDKRYRKFTLCFYGGFDGWDYYRTSRSTADDFRYKQYRGNIDLESGEGINFSVIREPQNYGFDADTKAINSDWYAYLSAIRQFANPKTIDINVLTTPGIDYVNNKALVDEVINMVEEERADSIYIVTTPDKPFGAGDAVSDMYSSEDVVDNLEYAEIDSNYTCSYYPWVKYYDPDNSQYIYLPPTRDVVRNLAYTDNTKYPWFAAAGWDRGDMGGNAIKPKKILKLAEQDELYDGRINFINNFANDGMKIWGDKNFQLTESQMNRISKRRLLLRIRKLCAIAAIGLIFDPNDNTTAKAFESAVTPVLDNVMSNRGITDWRLEIDDSQEARDRLELNANIYIKPTPNLEYININFIITPSGVSFDDI